MPPSSPPRKELKDIPAECDTLHKDVTALNVDSIATKFIGILKVTALRVLEEIGRLDARLKSLEAFRDEAMKAYLEAKGAAEAAEKAASAEAAPEPPKAKPKKNGHGKSPTTAVPPETPPAVEPKP